MFKVWCRRQQLESPRIWPLENCCVWSVLLCTEAALLQMPCSAGPVLLQAAPDGACENGQSRCRRAWGDGDCRSGYFKVVGHVLWVSSKFVLTYQLLLLFFFYFFIYNRNACHGCTACVSCPLTREWRAFFLPSWLNNSFFFFFFLNILQ